MDGKIVLQAIRQWDAALRERNDYRDALAKVQRQHEEAVKEINQAMAVRIKVGGIIILSFVNSSDYKIHKFIEFMCIV